jgi:hypothetical protein
MRKIETLSRSELQELLQQLERLQSEGLGKDDKEDSEAEHAIFLVSDHIEYNLCQNVIFNYFLYRQKAF